MTHEEFKEHCIMQANWWMHAASNGHSGTRNVEDGAGRKYTQDELRDDAMSISRHHMSNYREACDNHHETV